MMAKLPLAPLTLATLTGAASAQQRTFYDSSGKNIGGATSDNVSLAPTILVSPL